MLPAVQSTIHQSIGSKVCEDSRTQISEKRDAPIRIVVNLKGHCHEGFAVLSQFSVKIIPINKNNASVKLRRRYEMNFIREG